MCHCVWLSLFYIKGAQYQVGHPPFQSDINQELVQVEWGHLEATGISGLSTRLVRGLNIVPWAGKNLGFWILCWELWATWKRQVTSSQEGEGDRRRATYVRQSPCWDKAQNFQTQLQGRRTASYQVPLSPPPPCSLSCYVLIRKHRRNLGMY